MRRLKSHLSHLISSLVDKIAISNSSGVKFENALKTLYRILKDIAESEDVTDQFLQSPVQAVDERHGVTGRTWNLSEETKAKMRQPKSEETKAKIKATRNEEFQKMVEFAAQVKSSESYIALQKIREKQQFIDKAIQEEFGTLGNVTLTKIRKAIK